jgi:hypothetical protein
MGQVPFEPPNVAGWPGGGAWLNSATILARLNYINQVTSPPQQRNVRGQPPPPPPVPSGLSLGTAGQAMAHYMALSLDDNVPQQARDVLVEYAGGLDASLSPEKLRSLVYLILGSPQFHLS